MKEYNSYDPKSLEYTKTSEARIDPAETKARHGARLRADRDAKRKTENEKIIDADKVYLLPKNASFASLPAPRPGHATVYRPASDTFELVEDPRGIYYLPGDPRQYRIRSLNDRRPVDAIDEIDPIIKERRDKASKKEVNRSKMRRDLENVRIKRGGKTFKFKFSALAEYAMIMRHYVEGPYQWNTADDERVELTGIELMALIKDAETEFIKIRNAYKETIAGE